LSPPSGFGLQASGFRLVGKRQDASYAKIRIFNGPDLGVLAFTYPTRSLKPEA